MSVARKVLWIFRYDGNEASYTDHVTKAGIDTVCINTISHSFPDLIKKYHDLDKKVWAWRWPGSRPSDGYGWHYFAPEQADFVADLFAHHALDGFIVDPESNDDHKPNDWNETVVDGKNTSDLATDFWQVIKQGVGDKSVHLGLTSGWNFPSDKQKTKLPWTEFIDPVDAVYPQTYWRIAGKNGPIERWGGDPAVGMDACQQYWEKFGKPIIPMAGELPMINADGIGKYVAKIKAMGLNEAHFYDDTPAVSDAVLAAIRNS